MTLLVTGATGCVGRAILRQGGRWFGGAIATQSLSSPADPAWAGPHLTGPLRDLPDQIGTLPDLTACIHGAAVVHRPDTPESEVFRVNVTEPLRLARRLSDLAGFRRFVLVSTIATQTRPSGPADSAYARSKLAAEGQLEALARERGFEFAVVRLATVYGPHDRGNVASLFRAVSRRRYLRVVPPNTRKTLLFADAAAAGLLVAADPGTEVPARTVLADPRPWHFCEVEEALAAVAGVSLPMRLPDPLPLAGAALGSIVDAALPGRVPLTLRRLQTLREDVAIQGGPASAVSEAALAMSLPLEEGFRRSYGSLS